MSETTTLPQYRHVWDTTELSVEASADFQVVSNHGYMVRVYKIELTDYPPATRWATRSVTIEGLHIRKDGQPGAHRRGGMWQDGEPMPTNLAALVEAVRPGWWAGGIDV